MIEINTSTLIALIMDWRFYVITIIILILNGFFGKFGENVLDVIWKRLLKGGKNGNT